MIESELPLFFQRYLLTIVVYNSSDAMGKLQKANDDLSVKVLKLQEVVTKTIV